LIKRIVFLSLANLLLNLPSYSQTDKAYVQRYDTLLMTRFFVSQKYTSFVFRYLNQQSTLRYRPNSKLAMGVGGTYGPLTLNLSYGFDFINPNDNDRKGKTTGYDLQAHLYSKRLIIDLMGQSLKGFYLTDQQYQSKDGKFYQRPDIRVKEFGVNGQYVLNHRRFSYRAALFNSDWQKKSAGSLLAGAEILGGQGSADSTLMPGVSAQNKLPDQSLLLRFFQLGPNIGYAYTLVIYKRFYLTGSVAASLVYEFNKLEDENGTERINSISSNSFLRGFAGYNGTRWAGGVSWLQSYVNIAAANSKIRADINTGKISASVVYRLFISTSKIKKQLPKAILED
jgi:hypothetical protein